MKNLLDTLTCAPTDDRYIFQRTYTWPKKKIWKKLPRPPTRRPVRRVPLNEQRVENSQRKPQIFTYLRPSSAERPGRLRNRHEYEILISIHFRTHHRLPRRTSVTLYEARRH